MVILVDEQDNAIGEMDKLKAHQKGLLHRAFSVFIFNHDNALLLQQRKHDKYHSGGLWTNTCCSHPTPSENTKSAAKRRLKEEMGLSADLEFAFSFRYHVLFNNGLIEHELDHIFYGFSNQHPEPNKMEVSAYKFELPINILMDIKVNPQHYTEWFKLIFERLCNQLNLL